MKMYKLFLGISSNTEANGTCKSRGGGKAAEIRQIEITSYKHLACHS